ncbi:MAG: NADH-quinone oxidoreductase subunit H [Thermus sp.]|uniref:NADH-quinone oxidoreductase subunit H n=1 Tax=Thermus brevis TaxID=2862456 RepID=A0ABS6ZY10_9DEIN|nr:NADH-quinone oxidoreductase subunit H [Thermus brevis]MBW6394923.1 NADH-quinone oxidoreductase subunit H [Thermus brevis]
MTALLALVLAPLFSGSVKWLKARLTHRQGLSPLVEYRNLIKLWRKVWIAPHPTTPLFLLGPILALLGTLGALALLPILPGPTFKGDFLLALYLLGLGRFFQMLAALDAGSSFGAQGGYREGVVTVLAEPGTLMALAGAVLLGEGFSLSGLPELGVENSLVLFLALASLALGLLAEGARMPVDDPTTHLELTMIHEAQILDHSGPLLALYELAGSLKMLFYAGLMALLLPGFKPLVFLGVGAVWVLALAYLETYGVKLRYLRLPDFLSYNTLFGVLALLGAIWRF